MRQLFLFGLFFLFIACQPASNSDDQPQEIKKENNNTSENNESDAQEEEENKLLCLKIKEDIYYDHPDSLAQYREYSYEGDQLKMTKRYGGTGYLQYSIEHFYNDKGQLIKDVSSRDGKLQDISVYTYDDGGEQTSFRYTDKDGQVLNTSKYENSYNDAGQLLVKKSAQNVAMGNNSQTEEHYKYNEAGQLVSIKDVKSDRVIAHTYNETGQLTEKRIEYKGNLVSITRYSYDKDGNLKESISENSSGKFSERRVFSYKCEEVE